MRPKPAPGEILEIEKIIEHKPVNGTILFRVKLKHHDIYPWLPLTELGIPCLNMILKYCTDYGISPHDFPQLNAEERAKQLFEQLGSVSDDVLNEFVKKFKNFTFPPSQMKNVMRDLKKFTIKDNTTVSSNGPLRELRERVLIEKCIQLREEQIRKLQEIEWQYNRVCDNRFPLRLQNNVDFSVPSHFTYVNNYIAGYGVNIPKVPPAEFGCGRDEAPDQKHKCKKTCVCMHLFDSKLAYNKHGRINHCHKIRGIRECNSRCRCDENCNNRVVQKGCQAKLLIFRTANGTGWGVKTLEFLPSGMFVGRYVGKVIPWDEGESLPEVEGRSQYLFDIDFGKAYDGHSKYTVDAFEYGNFTRFINHSCKSNLLVYNVWIESLDDDLHEIAFFTGRNIEYGEELTFNYRTMLKECRCGAFECVPTQMNRTC